MNVWANTVITEKGLALLAKLAQGNTLDIVEAVTGTGWVTPGLLQKQTGVTNPKTTMAFRPVSYPENGACSMPVTMTNDGLDIGYEATQVGVFATDPDEGKILFLIAQSVTADKGTTVPSETEMPGYSAEWTFLFKYGQADGVNVTVDPANTVSRAEMEGYCTANTVSRAEMEAYCTASCLALATTQATLPFTAQWCSVTYGNGKFVVVVDSDVGEAAYSTNGITWVETTMPSAAKWNSVTYGNGKFVAVGRYSDYAAYSTDGITWTDITLPSGGIWCSVTYGNGKFVAVADSDDGEAAYSTDGITWTGTTLPSGGMWNSVTYGNGKFVAVGLYSDQAAYSTDGITWVGTTMPSDGTWDSVTYGNGKFVAVGRYSDETAYSTDGITWIGTTLPSSGFKSVTYGNGKFVAVADSDDGEAAYSTDGITWTGTTLPSGGMWCSVTYGNGKFVAVADSGKAAYSTNGITWFDSGLTLQQNGVDVAEQVVASLGGLITEEPDYTYGTADLEAGVSKLKTGKLYFVYE